MSAVVLAPRSGEPVALYPLNDAAARSMPGILSRPEITLLANGQLDGSYVVRGNRPDFFDALLGDAVLVINAAAPGCGPLAKGPSS